MRDNSNVVVAGVRENSSLQLAYDCVGYNEVFPMVAVLIINWNGLADTLECLDSLKKQIYPNIKVIVLDNRSDRDELETIRTHECRPLCIQSKSNLGFAKGSNVQIRTALELGAKYILLLNNDAVIEPDAIEKMVSVARLRGVGIVGSRIYYYHRRSFLNTVGGRTYLSIGYVRDVGLNRRDSSIYDCISDRDWVSGCAMLIDSEVFTKVGLLDEANFPQSGEDYDICLRAERAGFRVVYSSAARVYHKVSKTRRTSFDRRKTVMTGIDPKLVLFIKHQRGKFSLGVSLLLYELLFRPIEMLDYLLKTKDLGLRIYYQRKLAHALSSKLSIIFHKFS